MIHEHIAKFITIKKQQPVDASALLDFARQLYLSNQLSIVDYRNLVRELENEGAKKPDFQMGK